MLNNNGNQLFIEGENNQVFVYIHMVKLCPKSASKILDKYAENYKNYSFDRIFVFFWDVNFPGEHLSEYRKTKNAAIGRILKGFNFIESCFDFLNNEKIMHEPCAIN